MTGTPDLLQQLIAAGAVEPQSFGPESRYNGLPLLSRTTSSGEVVRYVARRFIPPRATFAVLQRHRVVDGDRVDVLAGTILGNPLVYWQICDANVALDPDDVTATPGALIDITLPAGVPGA